MPSTGRSRSKSPCSTVMGQLSSLDRLGDRTSGSASRGGGAAPAGDAASLASGLLTFPLLWSPFAPLLPSALPPPRPLTASALGLAAAEGAAAVLGTAAALRASSGSIQGRHRLDEVAHPGRQDGLPVRLVPLRAGRDGCTPSGTGGTADHPKGSPCMITRGRSHGCQGRIAVERFGNDISTALR